MSGIDPAALAALVNEAKDAMLQATLDLGVPAEVLQARVHVGDLLAATVLPPEHGQDFIELLGQRISAQLPPDVRPGETLVLQVTGFTANQIVVRNLGVQNVEQPVPVSDIRFAPASGSRTATPPAAPPPTTPPPPVRSSAPQAAPSREFFVAASVRPVQHAVQQATRSIVRTVGDLLRSVKFPDTPLTRTAAAIAPQAPARLPSVLQRLEAALPRENDDARIATLKTLIGFIARLDPQNEETLPAQVEAYVSHVVEGGEPKLQQLLQALAQMPAAQTTQTSAPPQRQQVQQQLPQQPQQQMQQQPPQPVPAALENRQPVAPTVPAHAPSVVHARAAERSAAIDHDLKPVVLSLLRNPPAARTPALMQALNETFITLTAAQLNTLSSNAQTPDAIAFSLPVFFHDGGKPAQVRIARDGGAAAAKLDADNFRVAFVLDTAHMGTVAIDLQSSGRSVKIDVKTQAQPAAARFSETLDELRGRLERLRYRVASAGASVLPAARRESAAPRPRGNGLDLQA